MFLVMGVSLYTIRIVLQALGVEDYGIYSAVGGIITSLSFITSVLAIASQRFFSIEIGKSDCEKLQRTFNMIFYFFCIVGVIVILIAVLFGKWFLITKMTIPTDRAVAALNVFYCTILMFFISVLATPYQALIIAYEKMSIYAFIGIFDVIMKFLIAFVISRNDGDKLILYGWLMFGATILSQSIYIIYSSTKFSVARIKAIWDVSICKEVINFSSWTLFGSIAFICNTQGINLLLNVFFGPIVNAAFAISNQLKTTINQFSSNFYVAVCPSIIKYYSVKDYNSVITLFYFSTKLIFILLFIIIVPVIIHINELLGLWLGKVSDLMSNFCVLMLIHAIILSIGDPITTIIQAANKVKSYYLIVDSFTLLSLPLAYIILKIYSIPEITFIISITIFIIAHFIRLWILHGFIKSINFYGYFKIIVAPIVITVMLVLFLGYLEKSFMITTSLLGLFASIAVECLIVSIISVLIILSLNEKKKLLTIVKNKIKWAK